MSATPAPKKEKTDKIDSLQAQLQAKYVNPISLALFFIQNFLCRRIGSYLLLLFLVFLLLFLLLSWGLIVVCERLMEAKV